MITKCRFCDYKKETKLSIPILKELAEKDLPMEDYFLWMGRLMKLHGLQDYTSVKIHMGIKHKDQTFKYISPTHILDKHEEAIINGQ